MVTFDLVSGLEVITAEEAADGLVVVTLDELNVCGSCCCPDSCCC